MNLYLDGRTGKERRAGDREFSTAGEGRMITERRSTGVSAAEKADYDRVLAEGYWGASEDDTTSE